MASCNKDNEAALKSMSPIDMYLNSDSFQGSAIKNSDLNLNAEAILVKDLENNGISIVVPFKDNEFKFVVGNGVYMNNRSTIKFTYTHQVEYMTTLAYKELESSFELGKYVGSIRISIEDDNYVNLRFGKDGFIDLTANARSNYSNCSLNGLGECAARRIADGNWWDRGWCYMRAVQCVAQEMVSCYIDGCPYM